MLRDFSVCATPDLRTRGGTELLCLALAHRFATVPTAWRLDRAASGARIVSDGPLESVALSLSHTDELLVAVVSDSGPVGVDVERPRKRKRRYAAIANHLGWPSSLWARAGDPTEDEFLHLWTLWEAVFKSMPNASFAAVRDAFSNQAAITRPGAVGATHGEHRSAHSWRCNENCWLSVVVQSLRAPEIALNRVDRLAGDVESAGIQTIIAPEGKFHF